MSGRHGWFTLALLLLIPAAPLSAQVVRGTLVEEGSEAPVRGTLVTLIDAQGVVQAGSLSDDAGRFVIIARQPGRYTLRAERIGYASTVSPPVELAAGETREVLLRVASQAIALEGVSVVGTRRQQCVVRPGQGLDTHTLWEEARKALTAAAWTEERAAFVFERSQYEDLLDPRTLQVTQTGPRRTARVRRSFQSLPLERLLAEGFVQQTDSGTYYYGPDAEVLLSNAFLDQHCFRIAELRAEEPGLIGLAFEPVRGRAGIRGTLWLDRGTAELRYVEYSYPSPSPAIPSGRLGGRVEFLRLPTGEWIVQRWWLRTPQLAMQTAHTATGTPVERQVLVGLTEHGGEVLGIATRGGQTVFARTQVTAGQVAARTPEPEAEAAPAPVAAAPAAAAPAAQAAQRSQPARRDPSAISREEILAAGASTAFDLVQSLRPQWLRQRGQSTLRTVPVTNARGQQEEEMVQVPVMVYLDGQRLGDPSTLRGIPAQEIASLRFLDAREATRRWGSDHTAGAILVTILN